MRFIFCLMPTDEPDVTVKELERAKSLAEAGRLTANVVNGFSGILSWMEPTLPAHKHERARRFVQKLSKQSRRVSGGLGQHFIQL